MSQRNVNRTHPAANGSKWIRPTTRLALYLRDGMACCYCGATIEDGAMLTVDHVRPHSLGGSNETTNLVTACRRCNSARGNRSISDFAEAVAAYLNHGTRAADIVRHIRNVTRRKLPRAEARELIARRRTNSEGASK